MPRIVEISSRLDATADRVWQEVQTSRLLIYITKKMLAFSPPKGQDFPDGWDGNGVMEQKAWMWLFGFIPAGWQMVRMEPVEPEGETRFLRDNGYGLWMKRWDHIIEVRPDGDGTLYTDRITIDAGLVTPLVTSFAQIFYKHRQRRWKHLIANGFDYSR